MDLLIFAGLKLYIVACELSTAVFFVSIGTETLAWF